MRIRYCPKCGKAGLKWEDNNGKGYDGLTETERYEKYTNGEGGGLDWSKRWCRRCGEWVTADIGANLDQHKR